MAESLFSFRGLTMYSEAMRLLDMLEQISIVIVTVSNPKKGYDNR